MAPVSLNGVRYGDPGRQAVLELRQVLTRKWRFIGQMLAGIFTVITAMASAAASVMGITEQVQAAHFVNQLA